MATPGHCTALLVDVVATKAVLSSQRYGIIRYVVACPGHCAALLADVVATKAVLQQTYRDRHHKLVDDICYV